MDSWFSSHLLPWSSRVCGPSQLVVDGKVSAPWRADLGMEGFLCLPVLTPTQKNSLCPVEPQSLDHAIPDGTQEDVSEGSSPGGRKTIPPSLT